MPFFAANFCQVVCAGGGGSGFGEHNISIVRGDCVNTMMYQKGGGWSRRTFSLGNLISIPGSESKTPLGVDAIGQVESN